MLVRQYRKDGILCYQVSTSTTWSETRTRIRVSGLWGKIMAFRRWLQLNRFCGCWNLNDPRVRYLDVMLESYNDSFVLFFAFQMSMLLWIALVSVLTTGAPNVVFLLWGTIYACNANLLLRAILRHKKQHCRRCRCDFQFNRNRMRRLPALCWRQ